MKVGKVIACMLAFSMLAIPVTSIETAGMPSQIVITVQGGFGLTITIRNDSGGPLPGTEWSVEMKGLIFSGAYISGTIDPLANEVTMRLFPVGIGPGIMTIRVGNESSSVAFFIMGPFVFLA